MNNRLIVVSNRLPLTLRKQDGEWTTERSSGGLASAMNPLLARNGGIWIGWSGYSAPDAGEPRAILEEWRRTENCVAVDLSAEVAAGFYEGYANRTLWPVFHSLASKMQFDPTGWESYIEANRIFCRAVADHYRQGDLVWVHDYQLVLLPQMLREQLPDSAIGFFLHIPFPSGEIFPVLPHREDLLNGLLGADLLAFQTHGHLQQFRSSLLRVLGVESRISEIAVGGRTVRLEALPIGIAPEEYTGLLANDPDTARYYADWNNRYQGLKVLLAVDRLDYTKGIPERLRAYARFLRAASEWKGKVVLIQVAVPTRETIGTYRDLRSDVNQLVGEINGKFGTPDWTPVVYINRSIERQELVALYKLADVGWVGPLRDGMNLVSKEYVACKGEGNGVLLLSEFAGAAAEMGEALLINPFDEERTATALQRALTLDERERRDRMVALNTRVLRNNVFRWGERFLSALADAASARGRFADTQPRQLQLPEIQKAYACSRRRLLLLDYDGTLVRFADLPRHAVPPRGLVQLLGTLASHPRNCVVVISGRRADDLQEWFGGIEGLWLAAEHGAELRMPGSPSWEPLRPQPFREWKPTVLPILDHFVERIPGSFVEEKKHALVWHYRMAEPEFGAWLANELVAMLEAMLSETELRAFRGAKTVEVKPVWANKGEVLERLLEAQPNPDFLLAIGDDRTDEDLFERMPGGSWTVHVGPGPTRAALAAPDVGHVRELLTTFAATAAE
jgi:trehalose 6-phosphate synthase/phosphatase